MPNISSDTLFHFTNFENLKGILKYGFYPRYSIETQEFEGKAPYVAREIKGGLLFMLKHIKPFEGINKKGDRLKFYGSSPNRVGDFG